MTASATASRSAITSTATPTPYVRDVLLACHQTGRPVAVISNNAQAAVATYLQAHHLAEHIDVIVGRTDPDPRLLKPHPHLVLRALDALHGDPATSAFIGDSTSDIQSEGRRHPQRRLRQQAGQARAPPGRRCRRRGDEHG